MCFSGPGSELDTTHYQIIKEGYLDCKSKYLGVVSHWEKNYFVLTGRGLSQYVKQGNKTPKMVYKLNGLNCGGCRRVSDEEKKYAFEVSGLGDVSGNPCFGANFLLYYMQCFIKSMLLLYCYNIVTLDNIR